MPRRLWLIALLAVVLLTGQPAPVQATELVILNVPYRTQLDGSLYQGANCGPASLAMVLNGFGQTVSIADMRAQVNDLQGTWGDYNSGTAIENLGVIARRYGVEPLDLWAAGRLRRWTLDDVRAHLVAGRPVVPQVWYPGLPGRENARYRGDHFIVLTGFVGGEFFFHDPIDSDFPGSYRRITEEQLILSWTRGDLPFAALAFTSPSGLASLRTERANPLPPPPAPVVEPEPTATPTATPQPTATLTPTPTATPYEIAEPLRPAAASATPTPLARPGAPSAPSRQQIVPLSAWLSEWMVTTALSFTLPERR